MSANYRLQIDSYSEYSLGAGQKRIDCLASADSLPVKISLDPNLREPKRNKIVDGIIDDITKFLIAEADSDKLFVFPDPVHIVCEEAVPRYNEYGEVFSVEIRLLSKTKEFIGHGVINGGHRLLAIKLARLLGLNLSRVRVPICLHIGVSDNEVAKLANRSNRSTKVTSLSLLNADGTFDRFKDYFEKKKMSYPYVSFYENQEGIPSDPRCTIIHLIVLLASIDVETHKYKPDSPSRHPIKLARGGISGSGHMLHNVVDKSVSLLPLIDNLVLAEEYLYRLMVKTCQKIPKSVDYPLAGVSRKYSAKSYLPNGCEFNYRIHQHISLPVISSFRVFIEDKKWSFPFYDFYTDLVDCIWDNCYKSILVRGAKKGATGDLIVKDFEAWDKCYAAASQFAVNYLRDKASA